MTSPFGATVMVPIGLPPMSVILVGVPSTSVSGVPSPFTSIAAAVIVNGSLSGSVSFPSTLTVTGVSSITGMVSLTPTGGSLTGVTVIETVAVSVSVPSDSV